MRYYTIYNNYSGAELRFEEFKNARKQEVKDSLYSTDDEDLKVHSLNVAQRFYKPKYIIRILIYSAMHLKSFSC